MDTRGQRPSNPSRRTTRRVTFLTLLLLAVAAPAGFVLAGEHKQSYVVVFRDDSVSKTVADEQVYLVQGAPAKTHREIDSGRVRSHVIQAQARLRMHVTNLYESAVGGFSAELTDAQVRMLERDPAVASVMRDEEINVDEGAAGGGLDAGGVRTVANPRNNVPSGIRRVGAVRGTHVAGRSVERMVNADVAVIDTGIERDHPDLNVVGGYNCTGRNRNNWDDVDGHGTHVAGIIGAKDNRFGVVGVAPGVRLWSVRVLGEHGSGRMSWLVCGIDWVTAQRERGHPARPLFEAANMSISYGGGDTRDCGKFDHDWVHQAICKSVAHGTVYVVAAGNESHNARQNRPAAYDEVITVSAMADYDGRGGGRALSHASCPYWTPERDDAFTTFSNYGMDIDLIAPGRCVLSTYPHHRYAWMSGTSMATPHVTGAVAVYRSMYPRATPNQVRMALQAVGTRDWRTFTNPDSVVEKAVWIGTFRQMPDFTMSAGSSTGRVVAGNDVVVTVDLKRVGGFTDRVTVSLWDAPRGISAAAFSTTGDQATMRISISRNARPGRYYLTILSVSGDIQRSAYVQVTVHAPPASAGAFTSGQER